MKKIIEVVPYHPNWPNIFDNEANSIKNALSNNLIEIYHIGSTSVYGLAAKPTIDILAVIQKPLLINKELVKIGFQYKGEYNIPLHYCFTKRGSINFNLHVYEKLHPEIELNLIFRNYLRSNMQIRDEYAHLKVNLLQDKTVFNKDKSPFTKLYLT